MVVAIDNFFGCYLLYCKNPKYKGRTYIGFTVNPERRIGQHNAGKHKGGAWKTSGRGPWDMAVIVHGFPSDIAALRFEWAWQNPQQSRRLKHVSPKRAKESAFAFRVRVMSSMLCQTPWRRLPLTVRWLNQEYAMDLQPVPPSHMPIAYGPVTAKVKKHYQASKENVRAETSEQQSKDVFACPITSDDSESDESCLTIIQRLALKSKVLPPSKPCKKFDVENNVCCICTWSIPVEHKLVCPNQGCRSTTHLGCLAKEFLKNCTIHHLLPVEGNCPSCKQNLLWGDVVRHSQGFHQYLCADGAV